LSNKLQQQFCCDLLWQLFTIFGCDGVVESQLKKLLEEINSAKNLQTVVSKRLSVFSSASSTYIGPTSGFQVKRSKVKVTKSESTKTIQAIKWLAWVCTSVECPSSSFIQNNSMKKDYHLVEENRYAFRSMFDVLSLAILNSKPY